MVAMKVTADVTGLQAAAVRMMEALQLQAVEAVGQVGYEAAAVARDIVRKEATYRGPKRTSVNPRTGMPYVIAGLLERQIWRGDVAVRGTRVSVPVGLLPATGRGRQMVRYWRLINYGRATPRTITARFSPTGLLHFPRGAWRRGEVRSSHGGSNKDGSGYTFLWVNWPGVSRPHHFMGRSFYKAMFRARPIMRRALMATMAAWGQR
jgi:hypothetical protein